MNRFDKNSIDVQKKVGELSHKNDPMISFITLDPTQAYYWDTKNGQAVAFLKMAASLVTGKAMDDSVEGKLELD